MKNFLFVLSCFTFLSFTAFVKAENTPLPDLADEGFTRYIQHYALGSNTVLIFETNSIYGTERFGVAPNFVDENIEVLNKYLKWSAMAKQRGDIINKEIGTIKGFDFGMYYYWNKYEFETNGDSRSYHLVVTAGTKTFGFQFVPNNPDEKPSKSNSERTRVMSFNDEQVKQLIQRMQDFKEGKVKTKTAVESDYK